MPKLNLVKISSIIALCIMLLMMALHATFAATAAETAVVYNQADVDKKFDAISLKLSTQNLNLDDLKNATLAIENLNRQAQQCVEDNQHKIAILDDFLKQTKVDKSATQNPDYKYLQSKIATYTKSASSCRLFVIRSQVALIAYKQIIQKLSTERTMQRSTPIWLLLEKLTLPSFQHFDFELMYAQSGIALLKQRDAIILSILVILGALLGSYARKMLNLLLSATATAKTRRIIRSINTHLILLLPISLMISCYFMLIYFRVIPSPSLLLLSFAVFYYLIVIILAKIIIFSFPQFDIFKGLLHQQVKPIYTKLRWLINLIFSYYAVTIILRDQNIPANIADTAISLFFTTLIISTAWFCWFFITTLCVNIAKPKVGYALKIVIAGPFSIMLLIQLIGYHRLAFYLFIANILTIFLSFITWILFKLIEAGISFIENNKSQLSQQLRYFLGVKPYKKIFEFELIRIMLGFIVLCAYLILLLKVWKISVIYADQTVDALFNGFKFGGLEIIPSRIVTAIIIFALSLLCGRSVATSITRHHQFEGEKDTQVAIASIIKYVWVAITVLVALLISGFNFTNLAIIAGALSVGIGLGMQHIVTNFVSGLILLLEKPIKPGDRIAVGNVEGFVRKIRARSTQISTPANEDVIVPNSDLINQQVTNYMFRNRNWRFSCKVGIAYTSDIDLAQRLPLEIANRHPDVIKEGTNKPTSYFYEFGASSLNFILYCVLADVNKKDLVRSELNFAIFHAFKQHNIEIAFPQIDVHLKKE